MTQWRFLPLVQTPDPGCAPGAVFDAERVRHVCRFFRQLRHTSGRHSGADFVLFDWQVEFFIAPVFGWVDQLGFRIVREVWFAIPRKNGKSTLCSGVALYLAFADREPAAQVIAAAKNQKQAEFVFLPAKRMALGSPGLAKRVRCLKQLIENPVTGSTFRPVPKDGASLHGANIHGAVIDEVHVYQDYSLIEAIETGVGNRQQPLIVFITTADSGDNPIYGNKHEYLLKISTGTIVNPQFFGVLFGADSTAEDFDPFDLETIKRANPGFGTTITEEYLKNAAQKAATETDVYNSYCRLHLNIRTKQATRFFAPDDWSRCGATLFDERVWKNQPAYGGLDLSATTDLSAFTLHTGNGKDGVDAEWLFWMPEERAEEVERRTKMPVSDWVKGGHLILTEGNVVDYEQIRNDIDKMVRRLGCKVVEIGYDPWNATETEQRLTKAGYRMVPVRQGYVTLHAPMKEVQRLVLGSEFSERPLYRHRNHPVMRFCAECVEAKTDDNGNVRPIKPDRRNQAARIDGFVAALNAMSRLMAHQYKPERRAAGSR